MIDVPASGDYHCPDCNRLMVIEHNRPDEVRVTVPGSTPPADCCQKNATGGFKTLGFFVTSPEWQRR